MKRSGRGGAVYLKTAKVAVKSFVVFMEEQLIIYNSLWKSDDFVNFVVSVTILRI